MVYQIRIPYGNKHITASIPEKNIVGIYQPGSLSPCEDLTLALHNSLQNPIGVLPLTQTVKPGEKIVILVDDHTRATPTAKILPYVLNELESIVDNQDDILILITHGTHSLSTPEEVRNKIGNEIVKRYRIEQHRCDDETNQVFMGLTSRGTPVWLNRLAVEADRRIGIGHIGPSPYAGYSGGGKLILPGIAALDTINANHSLVVLGFRKHGQVDLPCRLDLEEAADMLPMDMVIDVVLCKDNAVAAIFAGSPREVFQAGLPLARIVHEVSCPSGVDFAVTSGYPYDTDLYQAVRAVEYADTAVRPGGSILLASPCKDGIGGKEFYNLMNDAQKKTNDYLRDIVRRNGKVTFGVLGYALARIKTEKRLLMVTDGIHSRELIAMGFQPVDSLQDGIDTLLEEYGTDARMVVFPEGSSTIPVTADN